MPTVHLRINDATNSQPVPVRLRVTGPEGEYFPPLGRTATFSCGNGEDVGGNLRIGRETFAYIDGTCEIPLPEGVPLRIRAQRGLEYEPLDETIVLKTGQISLRLNLSRWCDLRAKGWLTCESRCHFLSAHAAALEAAAEDLTIVNLLAKFDLQLMKDGETYTTCPNLLAFSGQSPALKLDHHAIFVGTQNIHRALGRLSLLYAHRVIYPLAFGEPFDTDDWSLLDWSAQCRRKKGLVVWSQGFTTGGGLLGGEALIAAILGKVDAFEFDAQTRAQPLLPWYYHLLNAGLRIPLIAGSGKDSNRQPLGAMRTYTRIGADGQNWVEAIREGRTFITNGPLLEYSFDDTATVRAECLSRFEKLEVVVDGQAIAATPSSSQGKRFAASLSVPIPPEASWIAVRCIGGISPLNSQMINFAHTSPIFRRQISRNSASCAALRESIERVREWALQSGQYRDAKWKLQLLANCEIADSILVDDVPSK